MAKTKGSYFSKGDTAGEAIGCLLDLTPHYLSHRGVSYDLDPRVGINGEIQVGQPLRMAEDSYQSL